PAAFKREIRRCPTLGARFADLETQRTAVASLSAPRRSGSGCGLTQGHESTEKDLETHSTDRRAGAGQPPPAGSHFRGCRLIGTRQALVSPRCTSLATPL
ncbi:hypothetical protein LEMLEM_LOCUS1009, partial [Lemmus lemmus]